MMAISAIQFTQEQARTLTGVTPETIRHWRKAVPYLSAKPGKSARFTFADLVGLAITRELVASFGVHITNVGAGVDALFRTLADARPSTFEGAYAFVEADKASLHHADEFALLRFTGPSLIVPCDPLISRMRDHMLPVASAPKQAALPFPPHMVRG
jgi:hypothetical protein